MKSTACPDDNGDSPLSTTANVVSIARFLFAIIATLVFYYKTGNSAWVKSHEIRDAVYNQANLLKDRDPSLLGKFDKTFNLRETLQNTIDEARDLTKNVQRPYRNSSRRRIPKYLMHVLWFFFRSEDTREKFRKMEQKLVSLQTEYTTFLLEYDLNITK